MDDDDIIAATCLLLRCRYNAGGRFDVTEKTAFHMDTQLFATPPPEECVLQSTSGLSRTLP